MKQLRRFGEDFALAADRGYAEKFRKLQKKQPPGQHGYQRQYARLSPYGRQLLEKQKLRFYYQLSEEKLSKYYDKASSGRGSTSENLLQLLERRLDNILYRAGFVDTHAHARQIATHGHFEINGRRVDVPSYLVDKGDQITYAGRSDHLELQFEEMLEKNQSVDWLKVDKDNLAIEVVDLPDREVIDTPVDESLVIEYYSR